MFATLFLALSLNHIQNGHVDLTEQELTQYVNQHAAYNSQYGIPGLFDVDIKMDSMNVTLGRKQAQMADVHSSGRYTLALPDQSPVNGTITANFRAKPRYSTQQGAIYLDQFTLVNYQITPASVEQQFGSMVGYLLNGLQERLKNQPAYVLSSQNSDQRWLKQHVTGFELLTGKLRLQVKE